MSNTYKGNKHHSTVCDQVEKCLDLAMLFELSTNLVTISLILKKVQNRMSQPSVLTVYLAAEDQCSVQHDTRLNVADEKSAARTLALNTLFNNRLVHLIVSFTFRTAFGQSGAIASRTTVTRTSAI